MATFAKSIQKHLSIYETSLSNSELNTVLTNKAAKGRKETIVALITETKVETVISSIEQIPIKQRGSKSKKLL